MHTQTLAQAAHFELRFQPLRWQDSGFCFPCDSNGHVNLDEVGERARNNYFFARALVGRDYAAPEVRRLQ